MPEQLIIEPVQNIYSTPYAQNVFWNTDTYFDDPVEPSVYLSRYINLFTRSLSTPVGSNYSAILNGMVTTLTSVVDTVATFSISPGSVIADSTLINFQTNNIMDIDLAMDVDLRPVFEIPCYEGTGQYQSILAITDNTQILVYDDFGLPQYISLINSNQDLQCFNSTSVEDNIGILPTLEGSFGVSPVFTPTIGTNIVFYELIVLLTNGDTGSIRSIRNNSFFNVTSSDLTNFYVTDIGITNTNELKIISTSNIDLPLEVRSIGIDESSFAKYVIVVVDFRFSNTVIQNSAKIVTFLFNDSFLDNNTFNPDVTWEIARHSPIIGLFEIVRATDYMTNGFNLPDFPLIDPNNQNALLFHTLNLPFLSSSLTLDGAELVDIFDHYRLPPDINIPNSNGLINFLDRELVVPSVGANITIPHTGSYISNHKFSKTIENEIYQIPQYTPQYFEMLKAVNQAYYDTWFYSVVCPDLPVVLKSENNLIFYVSNFFGGE